MPSKRTPVSLELTSVRSNKCGVFCACFGKLCVCGSGHMISTVSLLMRTWESALQQVSVPHQLQHDCQQLMFLTFFYSKAYFHQHHLSQQTNPAIFRLLGSCSPGYIIIHTPICVENTTQQYESDPSGRLCYLTTYIGLTTDVTLCLPPGDKILAQLA